MRLGKPLHQLVCMVVTMTLLASGVGAVSFHDDDNGNAASFSQKRLSDNTTAIVAQHVQPASLQPSCCNHGCHAISHFLGSISSGFSLPAIISHTTRFSALILPNIIHLSSRLFKPPR